MKHSLIKFILILTFSIIFKAASAQYGFGVSYIKPVGDLGFLFKPCLAYEFVIKYEDEDAQFYYGFTISYHSLSPTRDTFYTYGMQNGNVLLPGYTVWADYQVIPGINLTSDYKIIDRDFSPLIGLDLGVYFIHYRMIDYVKTLRSLDETSNAMALVVTPKIGISYEINDQFLFMLTAGKTLAYQPESTTFAHYKASFGFVYYYD